MSMNDDPRGFRRGHPGGREYSQQPRNHAQPQRDRYEQFPGQDQRPQQGGPQERPQAPSFSAYKPEAYANSESQGHGGPDWDRQPPPRPQRGPMRAEPPLPPEMSSAPPRNEAPHGTDPYSMPGENASSDPFYQMSASDPYASRSVGNFDDEWDNGDPAGQDDHQFQNFYAPGEPGMFSGDPQAVHDEFFASADQHADDLPAPPSFSAGMDRNPYDQADYDTGPDTDYGYDDDLSYTPAPQPPFGREDPRYGASRNPGHRGMDEGKAGYDNHDYYDWDEMDQAPAPAAARPFHAPAVRDDDLDADFFANEDDYDIEEYEKSGGKKKLLAAALTTAIVVGGGAAYLYTTGQDVSGLGPALIAADDTPVKEQPEDPGGREFADGSKLIYDRLGGDSPREAQSASASGQSGDVSAAIPGIVTTGGGTLEERIENALRAQGGDTSTADEPPIASADTPRTVQTLTFGPDGSQQPVAVEPQTRSVTVGNTQDNAVASGIVVSGGQPSPSFESVPAPASTSNSTVNAIPVEQQPEPQAQPQQQQAETQVASISSGAQTAPIEQQPVATGAYFVQIGARNDPQAATEAFKTLQQRYASVIGNYGPSLRKADLGAKGVWYRLWVGPVDNKIEAEALCEQLKQAGMQACLVRKDQ